MSAKHEYLLVMLPCKYNIVESSKFKKHVEIQDNSKYAMHEHC